MTSKHETYLKILDLVALVAMHHYSGTYTNTSKHMHVRMCVYIYIYMCVQRQMSAMLPCLLVKKAHKNQKPHEVVTKTLKDSILCLIVARHPLLEQPFTRLELLAIAHHVPKRRHCQGGFLEVAGSEEKAIGPTGSGHQISVLDSWPSRVIVAVLCSEMALDLLQS